MMADHVFAGQWITNSEFAELEPRNVFFRELGRPELDCSAHRNRHILFRKDFVLDQKPEKAVLYFTADDYGKVYLNGKFVTQGPAPAYPGRYGYLTVDVTDFLVPGRNVLAVHTYYQGLINRVWVSGDQRHGLLCDLVVDGKAAVRSDESFRTAAHTGYEALGTIGYETQFLERYHSEAREVGFEKPDFDDSGWEFAKLRQNVDYQLIPQATKILDFEEIVPEIQEIRGNTLFIDFGKAYVGYLEAEASGPAGAELVIRCGQELNEDGTVRFNLRANCRYEECWVLSGGADSLNWFDYKSFRYAELVLPEGVSVKNIRFRARHYPFALKGKINPAFAARPELRAVWELCVHSQQYGVQEMIQDCMEREKGFYTGDGCYTTLTNLVLTGDDSMVRKLIDDAFASTFITPGLMTCLDSSFMQEIAEYSLMLIFLVLWHYRLTGNRAYLEENYPKVCALLEVYRRDYEQEHLLRNLDKWCVVEWPDNFRDGYDVDIRQGIVCVDAHVVMNAYYIEAIHCANAIASALGKPQYRDAAPLVEASRKTFYDPDRKLFRDGEHTNHASYIGNVFAYAYGLCPDEESEKRIEAWIEDWGISRVSMFASFPMLCGLVRHDRMDLVEKALADPESWTRIIREGGTATFEGWGKDTKWNTSLFHMTLSDGAVFLSDIDLKKLFIL